MRSVAIIQARVGSSRLPGKVLMQLAGKPVLTHVVERVLASVRLSDAVVATSDLPRDDRIEAVCRARNWPVVRGSETDVLSRYAMAARKAQAEIVVRVTSDCPLFCPGVLDDMLESFDPARMDYMSTNWPDRSFPVGLDCEVMRAERLLEIDEVATDAYDREHVTPYFYRNPDKFRLAGHRAAVDLHGVRITLDTQEDYDRLDALLADHPELADPHADLVGFFERNRD